MKNKNIFISVLVIVVAIIALVFLLHRHVEAPVSAPASADTATLGAGTDTTGTDDTGTSTANQNPSFAFACPDGKSITATFHLPDDASVDLALSDGRTMNLPHVQSADGASYASADGSIVFSNVGMSVSLTENGTATYANCTASAPGDASTQE